MYFVYFESFLKSLHRSGIWNKKFLDCNIKSWFVAMLCITALLFLLGCENTRHKIGISAKPFATDGKFKDSAKINYTIVFGKIRPKEDDDD